MKNLKKPPLIIIGLLLPCIIPIIATAYPSLDLYCKCGTISSYEVVSISKITFNENEMIISGPSETKQLADLRKIAFSYELLNGEKQLVTGPLISHVYPNPFNPFVSVDVNLPVKGNLNACVYNCTGQKVKVLFAGKSEPGHIKLCWDGKNADGRELAGGAYVLRLDYNGKSLTRKIIYAK